MPDNADARVRNLKLRGLTAILFLLVVSALRPQQMHATPADQQVPLVAVASAERSNVQRSIRAEVDVSAVVPTSTTWVLIAGLLGGENGLHRLESRLLAKGYRVLVIAPYAASVDVGDVSFSAMARRVDALLELQHIRQAHVVGHAHGGGIALRLAALFPDRVSALDLLDVGALPSSRTATLGKTMSLVPIVARVPGGRTLIRSRLIDGVRENSANDAWLNSESEHAYSDPVVNNVDRAISALQRLSTTPEPESVNTIVNRVTVPVTVVLGASPHPSAPPEVQVNGLNGVRNCLRVVRLPDVGHFPHEEAPDRVVSILTTTCQGRDMGVVR